jgi:hypothetical protein
MAISNELMGANVEIDGLSRSTYSAMGFFTKDVTQDRETTGGLFGLTTVYPIPIIKYSDSFTWHKYSFRVLPPKILRITRSGLEKTYTNALVEFLQTDLKGMIHFQPFQEIEQEIARYIVNLIPSDMSFSERIAFFNELVASTEEGSEPTSDANSLSPSQQDIEDISKSESMLHHNDGLKPPSEKSSMSHHLFLFLEKKATEASIVPFSIFTELFSQRFLKHQMLESTMEILQQFYIAIEDPVEEFELFPGDQYKLSVKCKRCHKCVTSPNQGILKTISSSPVAML